MLALSYDKSTFFCDPYYLSFSLQYPLYIVIMFDKWENGITIAFVIVGTSKAQGVSVLKVKDICANNRYFYMGVLLSSLFFLSHAIIM